MIVTVGPLGLSEANVISVLLDFVPIKPHGLTLPIKVPRSRPSASLPSSSMSTADVDSGHRDSSGIEVVCATPSPLQEVVVAKNSDDVVKIDTAKAESFAKFDRMSKLQITIILLSLGLVIFLFAIEETIVATSVSRIGTELDIRSSLAWLSTSYLLTTTAIQPILGRISDAIGVKRFLIIEIWIFVVGNIIAGNANNLTQIIAGRLIAGIGGAGMMTLSCIVITQLTHERQRASYMNIINVVFIISDSLGPILGGSLAKSGHWRWIFLLNAPFGPVISIVLCYTLHLPRTRSEICSFRDALTKVDVVGMFLIVACLSFFVVALNAGGQTIPWDSRVMIGLLCTTGVTFVAFWLVERRAKMPVAPTRFFVRWQWRNVPIAFVTRTLLHVHIFANTFYLPVFLQVTGHSTLVASALVIPFLFTGAISSIISNELCRVYGHIRIIRIGGLLLLPVGLGLMATLNESSSVGKIVGYSLIAGAGFGSGTHITLVIAQAGVPADELSTVTALVGCTPSLGGTLGVAVVGAVISNVFKRTLSSSSDIFGSNVLVNVNDPVETVGLFAVGSTARAGVVKAYVGAWQKGYWTLLGISGLEIVLCLFMRRVELQGGNRNSENLEDIREEKAERAYKHPV